jgi:hypothetical protein
MPVLLHTIRDLQNGDERKEMSSFSSVCDWKRARDYILDCVPVLDFSESS